MLKVLVTGGTGFVGQEVVAHLARLGFKVRLLSREPQGLTALSMIARYRCEVFPGGIDDPASLESACNGVDAVIHLVGIIAERKAKGQTFERVHIEGTRRLIAAAERAGVKRYIHMSALGSRSDAPARYHRTKWEAEQIVRASSLAWTLFRPSIIFGPRDQFVNQFAAMFQFPFTLLQLRAFPLIGGGRSLLQPIAVENVAAAFVGALAHPDTVGQTYELVGTERFQLRDILQEIATILGKKTIVEKVPWRLILRAILWATVAVLPILLLILRGWHFIPIPLFIGFFLFWFVLLQGAMAWKRLLFFPLPWFLARWIGGMLQCLPKPPLTAEQVIMLREDNIGDPTPASALFGLRLKSFRSGIREYLRS